MTAAGSAASLTANKALVAAFEDLTFNRCNYDAADELVAPGFVWYSPGMPAFGPGVPTVKCFAQALQAAFPDFHLRRIATVAEGDKVADGWVANGTHRGEWMGIPATGTRVEISGFDMFRIDRGKIVELRQIVDLLGLFRDLGILPTEELTRA